MTKCILPEILHTHIKFDKSYVKVFFLFSRVVTLAFRIDKHGTDLKKKPSKSKHFKMKMYLNYVINNQNLYHSSEIKKCFHYSWYLLRCIILWPWATNRGHNGQHIFKWLDTVSWRVQKQWRMLWVYVWWYLLFFKWRQKLHNRVTLPNLSLLRKDLSITYV